MKKVVFRTVLILSILTIIIFHKPIVQELNELEVVHNITSRVMGVEPANTNVSNVGNKYYAYRTLTSEEQLVYNQMADCLLHMQREVTISTRDEDEADRAFQSLISDHPEIFWISAYELTAYNISGIDSDFVFKPSYDMSVSEVQDYQEKIEEAAARCLNGIPKGADEYSIAKYLYEYVIQNTDYNKNAKNNQNICSVFLEQESVCMGYSKAYQYLLQKCGIESVIVSGESEQETHAWNLVKLEGDYYYVDVTWGDPEFNEFEGRNTKFLDYSFLGMNTADLLKTHVIKNIFPVPECVNNSCNYFVREGLYLEDYQKQTVAQMISEQFEKNSFVSIRCKDDECYQSLYDNLITNSGISSFISGNKISYVENRTYHVLSIFQF